MVKEYKDWLFVTVPEDSKGWFISKLPFGDNDLVYPNGAGTCNYIGMLPDRDCSWQIIGKGDAIDWDGIVGSGLRFEAGRIVKGESNTWPNYLYPYSSGPEGDCRTATESGYSLLRSLKMEPGTTLILKKNEK